MGNGHLHSTRVMRMSVAWTGKVTSNKPAEIHLESTVQEEGDATTIAGHNSAMSSCECSYSVVFDTVMLTFLPLLNRVVHHHSSLFNPFTAPACKKYPGWQMHGSTCKQCIFRSCNTSSFNAVCLCEDPFICQCKKENKKALLYQILHFYWSFSS